MKSCNVIRGLITVLAVVSSLGAEARLADVRNRKTPVSRASKPSGIYQKWQQSKQLGKAPKCDGGWVPDRADTSHLPAAYRTCLSQGTLELGASLPVSYDMRSESLLTPVRDQKGYNTCWAFSTLASVESCVRRQEGVSLDLSENNVINRCGYNRQFNDYGSAMQAIAYLLRWDGPVLDAEDAYPRAGQSPTGLSPARHVQEIYWVPARTSSSDNAVIKSMVCQFGAMRTSLCEDSNYLNGTSGAYYYTGSQTLPNHAVCIVGWDDNYLRTNFKSANGLPPGNGAFLVRNSKGSSHGDNGYFHVSYYDPLLARAESGQIVVGVEPSDNYDSIYQHDRFGFLASIGSGDPSASEFGINVYEAENDQDILSVGFYTLSPQSDYCICLVTNIVNGVVDLAKVTEDNEGTCAYAGYHTVKLNQAVRVRRGEKFGVYVELTSPNGDGFPMAIEQGDGSGDYTVSVRRGECLLFDNGTTRDLLDYAGSIGGAAHFCIKAYGNKVGNADEDGQISADGGTATFDFIIPGGEEWLLDFSGRPKWVTGLAESTFAGPFGEIAPKVSAISYSADSPVEHALKVTVGVNSGSARKWTIPVTCNGVVVKTLVVSQAGKSGGGSVDPVDPDDPDGSLSFGPGKVSTFKTVGGTAVVVGVNGLSEDYFCDWDYFGAPCFVDSGIVDAEKAAGMADDNFWCGQISLMNMFYLTGWSSKTKYATVDDMLAYFRANPRMIRYASTPGDFGRVVEGSYGYDSQTGENKFLNWFKSVSGKSLSTSLKKGKTTSGFPQTLKTLLGGGNYVMQVSLLFFDAETNDRWCDYVPVSHAVVCCGYELDTSRSPTDMTALTGLYLVDSDNDQDTLGGGASAPNSIVYCPVEWDAGMQMYYVYGIWGTGAYLLEDYVALAKCSDLPPDPSEITVAFNANGGKVSPTSAKFHMGDAYASLPEPSERAGYVFAGWWTGKTDGVQVMEGDTVDLSVFPTDKPTLYARWLKAYTLTLKGEATASYADGSFDKTKKGSVLQGESVCLSAPDCTFDSKGNVLLFQKWTVSPASVDLGVGFEVGSCETEFTMPDKNVTLTPTYIDEAKCGYLTVCADISEYECLSGFHALPPENAFEWSPDGKTWYKSGRTALLKAGTYTVQWHSLSAAWAPPSAKTKYKVAAGDRIEDETPVAFTFVPVVEAECAVYENGAFSFGCPPGGSVSVSPKDGRCLDGKTVSLTAKWDKKKYAFVGWTDRQYLEDDWLVVQSTAASYKIDRWETESHVAEDGEGHPAARFAAVFRPIGDYSREDMDSSFLSVFCSSAVREVSYEGVLPSVTLEAVVGCAIEYSLDVNTLCQPLVYKTSGSLPKGLKFKDGVLSGIPTKAGESSFVVKATNPAGHWCQLQVAVSVKPLPSWLAGESRAMMYEEALFEDGMDEGDAQFAVPGGLLELSVTSAGKASAKLQTEGGKVSIAPKLEWYPGTTAGEDGMYMLYYEKETKSAYTCLQVLLLDEGYEAWYGEANGSSSRVLSGNLVLPDAGLLADESFRNNFCNKYYTVVLTPGEQKIDGFQTPIWLMAPGYLTVKTDKKGVAKVSGKLSDGQAISGSATLLPIDGEIAQLYLFVTPSAYKKTGFYATVLDVCADGSICSERGDWKTPPVMPAVPGVFEADPPGFLSMSAEGRLYGSVASLEGYYMTLQADMPESGLSLEYSYKDGGKQTQYEHASAVDLGGLIGSLSLVGKSNGSIAVPASKKIWKDSEGYYNYWESKPDKKGNTEPILNPAEASISFAKATGVFSGKFKVYFDYATPKYGKYGDESYVPQHKAVSVPYAGVVLNDVDGLGNFTIPPVGQASGQYAQTLTLQWEDDKGKTKTKTYKKTTAIGVNLTF